MANLEKPRNSRKPWGKWGNCRKEPLDISLQNQKDSCSGLLFPLSAISNLYCSMGSSRGARQNVKCICLWYFWVKTTLSRATFKIFFSSVFLGISRHACQSSGCDCTLLCRYYLQPEYKNNYGYPGPLPNHHSFWVLILKLLKPYAFLFSEFSFFFKKNL